MHLARKMIKAARDRSFLMFSIIHENADPFKRDELIMRFHEHGNNFSRARGELLSLHLVEQEKNLLKKQARLMPPLISSFEHIIELTLQGKHHEAESVMLNKVLPIQNEFVDVLSEFIDLQNTEITAAAKTAHDKQQLALLFLILGSCLFLILSILISHFVYRRAQQLVDSLVDTGEALQSINQELEFQKFALDRHAIVSIADANGKITYANKLFCQISQYSEAELLGQDHRLLNSAYHPKAFFVDMWHTIASGKVWKGEVHNRKKNGDYYWVETTIVPFLDNSGKPERYVSIHTEITAIKEAEAMLKQGKAQLEQMVVERTRDLEESRNIMQSITGAAQDAIAMTDDAGNITYWNEAAQRLFNHSSADVMGKSLPALIAPAQLHETYQHTFIDLVSSGEGARTGKTVELAALNSAGCEFPIEISLSAVKIRDRWHGIGIMRDISERKEMERLLLEQATTDPLTGIHNRRKFDELMKLEQHRATRYQAPFSLILFDIDHFKQINDSFGHPAGDAVLKDLASLVASNIRDSDFFARWGGEEFSILAGNCNLYATRLFAEKLRHLIASHTFPQVNKLTCSFGATEYLLGESVEALLARADNNLRKAKQQGRNRIECG